MGAGTDGCGTKADRQTDMQREERQCLKQNRGHGDETGRSTKQMCEKNAES